MSVRLGHGLYPVDIASLTLTFPWQHIARLIKVLLPVVFFRASAH